MARKNKLLVFILLLTLPWQSYGKWESGKKSFADVVRDGIDEDDANNDERNTTPTSVPEKKHQVRNVYDGDTFTLVDGRRVRLLGIDTPELDEKQPFSQEAKMYTKDLCNKKEVWLEMFSENRGSRTIQKDHYGRLLANVWVQLDSKPSESGNRYLCVNEGLVEQGLATAYIPTHDDRPNNWPRLVELQKKARAKRIGIWENFSDTMVFKTKNGAAFHLRSCEHLRKAKHLTEMRTSTALDRGLHPCRSCLG